MRQGSPRAARRARATSQHTRTLSTRTSQTRKRTRLGTATRKQPPKRTAQGSEAQQATHLVLERGLELLLGVAQHAELVVALAQPRLPPPVLVAVRDNTTAPRKSNQVLVRGGTTHTSKIRAIAVAMGGASAAQCWTTQRSRERARGDRSWHKSAKGAREANVLCGAGAEISQLQRCADKQKHDTTRK